MKHAGIIIIGAAIGAYLLFAPKGNADGGSGGSLNIPNFGDMIGSSGTPDPSQDSGFQISDKILSAQKKASSQGSSPVGGFSQLDYRGVTGFFTPTQTELSQSFIPQAGQSFSTPSASKISELYGTAKKASTPSQNYSSQGGGNYSGGWGAVAKRR